MENICYTHGNSLYHINSGAANSRPQTNVHCDGKDNYLPSLY